MGRTASHRKATLAALSSALIEHKRITTTLPKAKALRPYVEPLITRAKKDSTHNRRQVFRKLQNKAAVSELFGDVAAQVGDRPGGYTRIIKLGQRFGDGAEMAMIELVDYNDVQPEGTSSGRSRTRRGGGKGRRRSRGRSKQTTETADQQPAAAAKADAGPAAEDEATTTVETPVAEDQTEPVEDRTEDTPAGVEEDVVEELKDEADEAPAAEAEEATDEDEEKKEE